MTSTATATVTIGDAAAERGRGGASCSVRVAASTRKTAEKAMPKGRMTSLDIRAMITSLETSIIGYRITNIYDITPKTCARRERWPGYMQRATTQTLSPFPPAHAAPLRPL